MKKILISLAALAAISGSALAERNYDISSPPVGETVFRSQKVTDTNAFQVLVHGSGYDSAAGNGAKSGGNSGGSSR
jgi:hypothetical protein